MRDTAKKTGDVERMQMWAGQSAKLARAESAGEIVHQLWDGSVRLLNEAA
jgi:nitronate monooxygenase